LKKCSITLFYWYTTVLSIIRIVHVIRSSTIQSILSYYTDLELYVSANIVIVLF